MPAVLRVVLEIGPKQRRVVALAPDWPGLERGGRTPADAIASLRSYLPRYAEVARFAGLESEFAALGDVDVVEEYPGVGSTDFWGISFAFSSIDQEAMSSEVVDRQLVLLRACWSVFDKVRSQVSSEMRRGPRGGGRDRDQIVRHVLVNEQQWARKLGMRSQDGEAPTDDHRVRSFRDDYCGAIRLFQAENKPARTWPLRYLVRHTAYHAMDHTWEMQDKDLTARTS